MKTKQIALAIGMVLLTSGFSASASTSTTAAAATVESMNVSDAWLNLAVKDTWVWAWPMINIYQRRLAFSHLPEAGLLGNTVPVGPPNTLSMLDDYIKPDERQVACPNQDVVYGFASLALDKSPVVVQIPDFGSRFWVFQAVDLRTDSFASLGRQYGTEPGFYLLAGPDWQGTVPPGIKKVFRSTSNTSVLIPRVFQADTPEDKKAVKALISGINLYPLADYNGKPQPRDWSTLKQYPAEHKTEGETRWVTPENFWKLLPEVLNDARPLSGEEAQYAKAKQLLDLYQTPRYRKVIDDATQAAEHELTQPLLAFHLAGKPVGNYWSANINGAKFGLDFFTRTATARSFIFVNKPEETQYFVQDFDKNGTLLDGKTRYTLTFPAGQTPPVAGFWSLTVYNPQHFFVENTINRYALGTRNKDLRYNDDGSLTLYLQSDAPDKDRQANWLPTPSEGAFSLMIRAYGPEQDILQHRWQPPAVVPKP
ncbi:DUF1254 domain-containing protein [Trabulsiella odontotermitis]|uniref:DUF1254 domain-containing protein n=1 Tax=Trabulsiella odontotermitis TaxID=379893 RepID=A0A0L0H124_9ENTR|nr:DUF1214 domain-containing protein [Trabulsiella odontotermitis]KNC94902.1 hypothetical protein GM31_09585 [Trabulsiella odontotermitis]